MGRGLRDPDKIPRNAFSCLYSTDGGPWQSLAQTLSLAPTTTARSRTPPGLRSATAPSGTVALMGSPKLGRNVILRYGKKTCTTPGRADEELSPLTTGNLRSCAFSCSATVQFQGIIIALVTAGAAHWVKFSRRCGKFLLLSKGD